MYFKDIDFASYADDNTAYTARGSIDQFISRLKEQLNLFLGRNLTR